MIHRLQVSTTGTTTPQSFVNFQDFFITRMLMIHLPFDTQVPNLNLKYFFKNFLNVPQRRQSGQICHQKLSVPMATRAGNISEESASFIDFYEYLSQKSSGQKTASTCQTSDVDNDRSNIFTQINGKTDEE